MSDFSNDERFDGLYINVAQTTRGIEPLLDTVFSFLRRKTDFFHGPRGEDTDAAVAKVNEVLNKHVQMYKKQKAAEEERKEKQKQAKAMREKKAKADRLKAEKKAKEEAKRRAEDEAKNAKSETEASDKMDVDDASEEVIELSDDGGFDISNAAAAKAKAAASDADADMKSEPEASIKSTAAAATTSASSTKEGSNKNDNDDDDEPKTPPPIGNGGTVPGKYIWTQTLAEVNLTIDLPENTRGRDLNVVIKKTHLKVQLKSQDTPIVDAKLTKTIICDDSFWTVEDGNRLVINLQKLHQMEWWNAVCIGDPEIDVTKVQPENSKLDELDGETRQTVEKMMFDQRQKALGLPSSEEQRKFDALEKFKQAHPEMDFSNAKMS